jgi:hypothetical protein
MQALPHWRCPLGQFSTHAPAWQSSFAAHDRPHIPQCRDSVWRFTQTVPQMVAAPAAQAGPPPTTGEPPSQASGEADNMKSARSNRSVCIGALR